MATTRFCTIPMDQEDFHKLTKMAKALSISRSALVRKCIGEKLATFSGKQNDKINE